MNQTRKEKESPSEDSMIWTLSFDGARSKNGAGVGIFVTSPKGEKILRSLRFHLACMNNEAEYESLVHDLILSKKRGIKLLRVFGDLELVVK